MTKELLFSVTAKDCEFSYTKGTGPGGQKRNKTSSAVHCTHIASGARGYSESSRSQLENKIDAFRKMSETEAFKTWHRAEVSRRTGHAAELERKLQESLKPHNIKIETRIDGRWTETKEKDLNKEIE